jgi:type II secretory pathway pseudopilin PulG
MHKLIAKRKNNGDTIIEVLICLAALGFILSITYSIATRAQQSVRSAQERVEALKLAEGQIEQLKYVAQSATPDPIFAAGSDFCLNNSVKTNFTTPLVVDLFADDLTGYPTECVSGTLYHMSIAGPSAVQGGNTDDGGLYEVRIRWQRLGGGVNEEVKLDYEQYREE